MLFSVLGPVSVTVRGGTHTLRRAQRRALLGFLLLNANRAVSGAALVEALWGGSEPTTSRTQIQAGVSALRAHFRELGLPDLLTGSPAGYLLRVEDDQLDLLLFERLVREARDLSEAGQPGAAAERFRAGLELWRGPALAGAAGAFVEPARARLAERRLAVAEDLIDQELERGRHCEVVGEFAALLDAEPLRERLRGQLMLALYRARRQAESLELYRGYVGMLREQHGLDPSPALTALQTAILRADPALGPAGTAPITTAPASAFPPPTVPAQLPPDIAHFTGREGELKRLGEAAVDGGDMGSVATTAIVGTAGVGKTALAVHWSHRTRDRFPDGQLYVNLHGHAAGTPLRPIQALTHLLHALGVEADKVPVDVEEAAGLYRSMLARRRVLILLDNAHAAEQVRPLLPGGPRCVVLVTSRERLAGLVATHGVLHLTLDVLDHEEAITLLARIAGAERVAAEPEAAAELVRACARLPLAVRIAGANLACQPGERIADYLARLRGNDPLARLTVDDDSQAAVRAAFDRSYRRLSGDVRRLFRLLGLVPGPDFTVAAAAALGGTTPERARRLLDRLAGAHLIEWHPAGRFAFHDLLRLYARERAEHQDSDDERDRAAQRLLAWYQQQADAAARLLYANMLRLPAHPGQVGGPAAAFGDHAEALAWLDAERANLVAAVQHAAEHGARSTAWLLADTLRGYFWQRRCLVDWLAVAHAGLTAAVGGGDLAAQAAGRLSLADAQMCRGRYAEAIEHGTTALALARQAGWVDGEAATLGNLSLAYWDMGDLQDAVAVATRAIALYRQTGRRAGEAINLGNLGRAHLSMGQLRQALDCQTRSLALHRALGSPGGQVAALSNLGVVEHNMGLLGDAYEHLTQSLTLSRKLGNLYGEAYTLEGLAALHRDAGRHAQALDCAQAAQALAHEVGDRRTEAETLNTLGTIQLHLARPGLAIDHHQRAACLARETGTRSAEIGALLGLAAAHQHTGRHDHAIEHAEQAIDLARRAGYRLLEGQASTAIAAAELGLGHHHHAADHARQALAIQRETGHRLGQAHALVVLGHTLRHHEGAETACPYWQEALELLTRIGSPDARQVQGLLAAPRSASPQVRSERQP
jgi:DNA-binding SARP family transcriptional activator/tetratricopeptide (TPR) repeat protein